jgi:hypothetical protein
MLVQHEQFKTEETMPYMFPTQLLVEEESAGHELAGLLGAADGFQGGIAGPGRLGQGNSSKSRSNGPQTLYVFRVAGPQIP